MVKQKSYIELIKPDYNQVMMRLLSKPYILIPRGASIAKILNYFNRTKLNPYISLYPHFIAKQPCLAKRNFKEDFYI